MEARLDSQFLATRLGFLESLFDGAVVVPASSRIGAREVRRGGGGYQVGGSARPVTFVGEPYRGQSGRRL